MTRSDRCIEWKPVWPECRPSARARLTSVISLIILIVSGVVWVGIGVGDGVTQGHPFTAVGAFGIGLAIVGFVVMAVSAYGFDENLGRRTVDNVKHRDHGVGIVLLARRGGTALYFVLLGLALYGITAWLAWRSGEGGDLLSFSKDNQGGATFALVLGVVCLLCGVVIWLLLRWRVTVEIYSGGVRRVNPSPFGKSSEIFVRWVEVVGVMPGEFRASPQSKPMRTVVLELDSDRDTGHRLDTIGRICLPVSATACEPNTVLAVLRMLSADPEYRASLPRPDALGWFRPPSQAERYRLSAELSPAQEGK